MIEKIYLDMDGVIANFEHRYYEMYGITPRAAEKHKEFDRYFDEFIEKEGFKNLMLMPGAILLLKYLENIDTPTEILSSTANEKRYSAISKQKMEWLDYYNITFKTNFVPGKRHKSKFATPNSIIIDDTPYVIEKWIEAGGIAIHHTTANSTLAQLRNYIKEPCKVPI